MGIALLISLFLSIDGPTPKAPAASADPPCELRDLPNLSNKADGLTLPEPFAVPDDTGLVTVKAECSGPVQWFAFASAPIKAQIAGRSIVLSVPRGEAVITVIASGLVTDQTGPRQTGFAVTTIKVEKSGAGTPGKPPEPPAPTGGEPKAKGNLYVTLVGNPQEINPAIVPKLQEVVGPNGRVRQTDPLDPSLKATGLQQAIANVKLPAIVVQDVVPGAQTAPVILVRPLPGTEAEAVEIVRKLKP